VPRDPGAPHPDGLFEPAPDRLALWHRQRLPIGGDHREHGLAAVSDLEAPERTAGGELRGSNIPRPKGQLEPAGAGEDRLRIAFQPGGLTAVSWPRLKSPAHADGSERPPTRRTSSRDGTLWALSIVSASVTRTSPSAV